MPIAKVETPDGRIARFEVPEGSTPQQVEAFAASHFEKDDAPVLRAASDLAGGFNEAIIGIPQFIGNALSAPLMSIGAAEEPLGDSLMRLAEDAGLIGQSAQEGSEKNKGIRRFGRDIGTAATVLLPVAGAVANSARIAKTVAGPGAVGAVSTKPAAMSASTRSSRTVEPILQSFRKRPGSFTIAELSSATGAAMGGAVARAVAPDSQAAEMAGEFVGGVTNPVANLLALGPKVAGGAKRALDPLTPGGTERQAARQLQNIAVNPKAAAKRARSPQDAPPGAEGTPAQRSGDEGLMALERALVKADAGVEGRVAEITDQTRRALRQEVESVAPGVDPRRGREFFEGRLARLDAALEGRVQVATEKARRAVQDLPPGASREQQSRIVRDEIEGALGDARVQEKALWDAVPEGVEVDTAPMREAFDRLTKGANPLFKKADEMPAILRDFFGGNPRLDPSEAIGEVQALRSQLLRRVRKERSKAAPDRKKIRALDEMADAALEVMGQGADDTVKSALSFSRSVAQRFRQGPVGRALGYQETGEASVGAGTTLDSIFSRQGTSAGEAADALARATDSPDARAAVDGFIRDRFVLGATNADGALNPQAAERFMRNNRELLERFPQTRDQLRAAIISGDEAKRITAASRARQAGLADKKKSRAALFLDAPVGKEVNRVFTSRDPRANMRELVKQARKDPTGDALAGLKAQAVDEVFGRAALRNLEVAGEALPSFRSVRAQLSKNRDALSQVLSKEELARLDRVTRRMATIEQQLGNGRSLQDVMDESPDMLVDLVSRLLGANIGGSSVIAKTSGASLVMAGAASRTVRNITNRIPMNRVRDVIIDAITSPDGQKLAMLLEKPSSPKQSQDLERRLNAWISILFTEEDQAQEQQPDQAAP